MAVLGIRAQDTLSIMARLCAGVFNSTPPTLADQDAAGLQVDSRGNLKVSMSPVNTVGAVTFASDNADAVAVSAANGNQRANAECYLYNGATWDRARTPNIFKVANAAAIPLTTDTAVWTPAAGKKFRLMRLLGLSYSVAARLIFKDAAAGTVIAVVNVQAGVVIPMEDFGNGILSALANNALVVNASAAGTLDGEIIGTEE